MIDPNTPSLSSFPDAAASPKPMALGSPAFASVMLLIVTLLWGLSFPLVKTWQDESRDCPGGGLMASTTLIALRMILALGILAVFSPKLFSLPTAREHGVGVILGAVAYGGFIFQVVGQALTTPAMSAFITSLASAWVPLLAWGVLGLRSSWISLGGIGLGIAGSILLAIQGESGFAWTGGVGITLIATVFFAVQILLLDRLGKRVRPGHLTVSFFATIGTCALALGIGTAISGPGLAVWGEWLGFLLARWKISVAVGLLTVFSTVLTFHWMNIYQPRVTANRAALIYLLEPVFAAIISVCLDHAEVPLKLLILGGGLILAGNCLVELPGIIKSARITPREVIGDPTPSVAASASGDV